MPGKLLYETPARCPALPASHCSAPLSRSHMPWSSTHRIPNRQLATARIHGVGRNSFGRLRDRWRAITIGLNYRARWSRLS